MFYFALNLSNLYHREQLFVLYCVILVTGLTGPSTEFLRIDDHNFTLLLHVSDLSSQDQDSNLRYKFCLFFDTFLTGFMSTTATGVSTGYDAMGGTLRKQEVFH